MKKNVLFIVIDSVTNDILFNKENSSDIAPFLNSIRKKSISGDKMYSEAPYTEAALMSLLASVDTMDNGGYMEKFKNIDIFSKYFKENGYKTFFNNYYPSICPSYMVKDFDEMLYIEGFQFMHIWDYRFKYFSKLYINGETSEKENKMLEFLLEDNFKGWILYLEKLENQDNETIMLNKCIDLEGISEDINILKEEYKKFKKNKKEYLINLFKSEEEHILFKIKTYKMTDKVHDNEFRKKIMEKYNYIFKKIKKLNLKKNIVNNKFPMKKLIKSIKNKDYDTTKGLLAGYKNSLFDKDLFDRINYNYDTFKVQRSFYIVSQEFFKWVKNNKKENWLSYIHIDDAHFPENFFTYDTNDEEIIKSDMNRIEKYLNTIPKNYQGSITYDLSLLYCDNVVKNIFEFLKKENLIDNTMIVITADHGFSYYFSPVREKYVITNYKENYNVPFLVYGKNIKPKLIEGYCMTKDIPATLLDLADIKIPSNFKGKSLLKYNGESYATLEYMGGGCPDIKRRPIKLGVRTDDYSVFVEANINEEFKKANITEIYDLKKDPFENNDLKSEKDILNKITNELKIIEKRFLDIKKQYGEDRYES